LLAAVMRDHRKTDRKQYLYEQQQQQQQQQSKAKQSKAI
jgi:hypothetical protein